MLKTEHSYLCAFAQPKGREGGRQNIIMVKTGDALMESCKCGRALVCSKCTEIPDRCKCEKEMLPEGYDYTLTEVEHNT